ncbi:hypothetical protein BH11CYA1_BH11CYA1_14880 [soil metagenome]
MSDKPDVKAEIKQESKLADPLNIGRLEADAAMRELGKRAIPIDTKLPAAFASGGNDFTIVGDEIAQHVKAAAAKMTPAQLERAERSADLPYRVIEAAGTRGPIPDVSAHRRSQEAIPIERQADVNRWITAAARIGEKSEVHAKPGETYSSIASNLLAERDGRKPTKTEVHIMATTIAEYNGKTGEQANSLKVNEVVKLPPLRKAV